jgi:hypothetical protein
MNDDLLKIATNLAYAGMPTHIHELQTTRYEHIKSANVEFAGTCVYIASQILEIANKTSKQ